MRKIFTFFLALTASVGMMNAKVTWNSSNISNLDVMGTYGSYSKEGVTLSANADQIYAYWQGYGDESMDGISFQIHEEGGLTFSNTLGKNFIKIEMTLNGPGGWDMANLGSGWSFSWDYMEEKPATVTWTGNAATVDLLKEASDFGGTNVKSIVFYFVGDSEEPDPTYTVALKAGTVNADKVTLSATSAVEGATITVTPDEEYEIKAFKATYNTTEEAASTLNTETGAYSFTMPAYDVTIEATIAAKPVPEGDVFAGFTATAGSGGFDNEDYSKLVDNKYISSNWTKWCANDDHKSVPTGESESCWWIDFEAGAALDLTGYILTTGNDTGSEHGRNPKNWLLKAKLNADDAWTTIATVTNDATMKNQSFKDYKFFVDQSGTYQYFRFEVFANQGASVMQLCELRLIGTEAPEPTPTPKYYVVGTMNSWQVNEAYEMTPNNSAETEEYMFTLDLTTTDQFKVKKVVGETETWYPEGTGNNYGEHGEITEDGNYTIYFRPNGDGGDDWFYKVIYVAKNPDPEPSNSVKLYHNFYGDWTETEAFGIFDDYISEYAKISMILEPGDYEFALKVGGELRGDGTALSRTTQTRILEEGYTANLTLNVDVKGTYRFYWFYDENKFAMDVPNVCGMYWKEVTDDKFEVTLGQESEVTLPKLYTTNMSFASNIFRGVDQVRLVSTDETVASIEYTVSMDGLGTITLHKAGECDIYAVHDITDYYCYDSVAFHLTVLAEESEENPKVWTSLTLGDVIKVGDQLNPGEEWTSANDYGVIKPAWAPYTLLRANIVQEHEWDDPEVTEAEDGAYYVLRFTHPTSGTSYLLSTAGKGELLAATATSDGLEVTNVEDFYGTPMYTFAVHEESSEPSTPTAISSTAADTKAVKVIKNGQLLIEHNGKTYNVVGTTVR